MPRVASAFASAVTKSSRSVGGRFSRCFQSAVNSARHCISAARRSSSVASPEPTCTGLAVAMSDQCVSLRRSS